MELSNIKWKPWIGNNYTSLENRILIVGESHYNWLNNKKNDSLENSNFTKIVVKEHGLYCTNDWGGIKNSPLFRNTERCVFKQQNVPENLIVKFWNSIIFYEFIQKPMKTLNHRPSKIDFQNGWRTFFNLLDSLEHKPTLCIFLGTSAINYYKKPLFKSEYQLNNLKWESKIGRYYPKRATIEYKETNIPLIAIKHPSRYFSWNKWGQYLESDLTEFKEEITAGNTV